MAVHLIAPATIKQDSWVQQNVDSSIIASIIPDIELMKLEPIIGVDLYAELLNQVENSTLTAINVTLLSYITPMLLKYNLESLAFAICNKMTATGVTSNDNENGATLTRNAMFRTMNEFQKQAEFYKVRLLKFMCDNNFTIYESKKARTSIHFSGKNNNQKKTSK
jgi:hypothetical protein